MSADTGLNQTAAQTAINNFLGTEVDIRLMTTALNYDDTETDLDAKEVSAASYSSQTLSTSNISISFSPASGTLSFENTAVVDFGQAGEDWGTVVDIAIHKAGTDEFIRADEVNDPQITQGEEVTLESSDLTYTLGN